MVNMKMRCLFAALLSAVVLTGGAALADGGSYTGNWLVTVKLPPQYAHTDCLALTDNGSAGSKHSGPVSSSGGMAPGLSGTFQVVKGLLVVNLEGGSDTGEVYYLTFIAHAQNGQIGDGVYNDPGFFAVTPLKFGPNGSC